MPIDFTDANGLPILRRSDINDEDVPAGENPFKTLDDLMGATILSPSWLVLGANMTLANGDPAALMYGSKSLADTVFEMHPPNAPHVASLMTRFQWLTSTATTDLATGLAHLLKQMASHE